MFGAPLRVVLAGEPCEVLRDRRMSTQYRYVMRHLRLNSYKQCAADRSSAGSAHGHTAGVRMVRVASCVA